MLSIKELLEISAAHHHHACPRQVLGVRMGMCAAAVLSLDLPQTDKRLYAFMETDGCIVDGVSVATGCWVGRRTLRVFDFGKMAATFVDTATGQAIRVTPHPEIRQRAKRYACASPGILSGASFAQSKEASGNTVAQSDWHAYFEAYQVMPVEELLVVQPVRLALSMDALNGQESLRVCCDCCGEEIFNGREIRQPGRTICRACAGEAYYAAPQGSLDLPGSLNLALTIPAGRSAVPILPYRNPI